MESKEEVIDRLIKGKEYLKCNMLYNRSITEIKRILNMPQWNNPKFASLLTSSIWNNNAGEVEKILNMEQWKDPKFASLLTSNIWQANAGEVEKILNMEQWEDPKFASLLTSNIWSSNAGEVEKILNMEQWEDPKFAGLLTSSIWNSNAGEVEKILNMPQWENSKYVHLLRPSIFAVASKNIESNIELFKKYGIDAYIANNSLRRNPQKQKILLEYLVKNNIPLLEDDKGGHFKLNKIINASNAVLRNKYHIDLTKLEKEREEDEPDLGE